MAKTYIENFIEDISYESLGDWCLPEISSFSHRKTLFAYQENAIKNAAKVLYTYFNNDNGKEQLYSQCIDLGMTNNSFNVDEYLRPIDRERGLTNNRFSLLQNYYVPITEDGNRFIKGNNFFNRMAFWMATGSGKSIVLIKIIEYLYYLQSKGLIPKKDIMLLLPREDLINQFKEEVREYNLYKDNPIELVNLKEYEKDKNNITLLNNIKVYFYRSDLIRDERKENILDFKDYDNNGDWYIFLDEAHRGETGVSLIQDYVSILSRNGYLFNFSATFTDSIDYATTCYNFNLEKFINAGYGKNIYLSKSYFDFKNDKDDFSEREKQKQVLKSLITFTMVKNSKKDEIYHNPLLVTLVNSINTNDSDLLIFFKKLEEIASGKVDEELFIETREELKKDFSDRSYVFGNEECNFDINLIDKITVNYLLNNVFNANTNGKIEILEGEKGKEIILKLETSESPFALIKIGDADKFQREKLGNNYSIVSGYDRRNYFRNINNDKNINLLLGSRSFYEGWDSNRPNIINFINIGGRDAKKYVLQAIGRGVRIEPYKGKRKRLPYSDENKNHLLETLFIFATDKNGVKSVLETIEEQRYTEEYEISLYKTEQDIFDLLIPKFKNADNREEIAYFYASEDSIDRFKNYFNYFDKNVILLKKGITMQDYKFLSEKINNKKLFQINNRRNYNDLDMLMDNIINHISFKNMVVGNIREIDDEIVHFKHIKLIKSNGRLSDEDIIEFEEKVDRVKNFKEVNKKKIALDFANDMIKEEEFNMLINTKPEETFKDLKIINLSQHYYLPLIYSEKEKVDYIKNIIKVESEVRFIKNLNNYLEKHHVDCDWMFSRIDENRDKLFIPYYLREENRYSKFYPDFIFWIKKGQDYKIVFVDPKGTSNADYINKVEEFDRIFFKDKEPIVYEYKGFNITFDLKLIAKDINEVPKEYRRFWLIEGDFSFLDI